MPTIAELGLSLVEVPITAEYIDRMDRGGADFAAMNRAVASHLLTAGWVEVDRAARLVTHHGPVLSIRVIALNVSCSGLK